jgi:hypothetical protein
VSSSGSTVTTGAPSTDGWGPDAPIDLDRDAPLVVHNLLSDLGIVLQAVKLGLEIA